MKQRLLFLIKYYVFWLLLFISQKLIFMIFNIKESAILTFTDWIGVIWHGLRLDLSAGAYILVLPVLIIFITSFFSGRFALISINIYTCIMLFVVLFLGVVDMDLYSYWGFKLDITPLLYLKTPREALASVSYLEVFLLVTFFILLFIFWLFIYRKLVLIHLRNIFKYNYVFSFIAVLILLFLFIPIRGGISIAPINVSSAYFHNNRFANHSAVNVLWNTGYSLVERKKLSISYQFMEESTATEIFKNLYPEKSAPETVIKREKVNIIMIILESFSNRIIGALGGESEITPELDKICRESMVFSNFFATGDRSDKGIVGILSGFPAQPLTSIINYPAKTQSLPSVLTYFHDKGYYTSFYYGGNINFANFRSYLTTLFLDKIISVDDFPAEQNMQKWGVPDEYLFEKMLTDIDTIKSSFFMCCFTLSSHDPYDFPMEPFFGASNTDDKSKSGFYYTDKCLGEFISRAKLKSWWDQTLIIILSDHGSRSPGQIPNHVREKFRIPMVWTGGAVIPGDTTILKYASQTDLPLTLLRQVGYDTDEFVYSKDIFDPSSLSFAMYFFNNGFAYLADSTCLIYDNNVNNFIIEEGESIKVYKDKAKAYMQVLSDDFNSR